MTGNETIEVSLPGGQITGNLNLPFSKSESNRALILRQLSGGLLEISNLSEAQDTRILEELLKCNSSMLNAGDGGTTFRFLTSFLAVSGNLCTLTGSARMKERPVNELVSCLRKLGAEIGFAEKEGFPPLTLNGFLWSGVDELEIDATISSQYISALLMIGPVLPTGLSIQLRGQISSLSYLLMTIQLMRGIGLEVNFDGTSLYVPHQSFKPCSYSVESDWSAAGYWFGLATLVEHADISLQGFRENSLQGDSVITRIMENWGIKTQYTRDGIHIQKSKGQRLPEKIELDFLSAPDLAQTLIVVCAATNTEGFFSGLKSLAIKETNRLRAMKTELKKVGIDIEIDEYKGTCFIPSDQQLMPSSIPFDTYNDHRMAMALSLLAVKFPVQIKEPDVVRKSYPGYWNDLRSAGFQII